MNRSFRPSALLAGTTLVLVTALGFVACRDNPVAPGLRAPRAPAPRASVIDDPNAVVFIGAGGIARCDQRYDEATASLLQGANAVFTLGDNVYGTTVTDFQNCYGPTWGQYLSITHPTPGEDDYPTGGPSGYYGYFGAAAGDPAKGYYSYDLGTNWHIVVLNSSIDMSAGGAQEAWLKGDLAATSRPCVLAYWHFPRFASYGSSVRGDVKPFWDDLYAAQADVVLNSHFKYYERFGQQTPAEVADTVKGLRQFIVGTGGEGLADPTLIVPRPNSQARIVNTYGVLKLTLHDYYYSYEFMPASGQIGSDMGDGLCHGRPGTTIPNQAPMANPGGPYAAERSVTFDGSASKDLDGNLPLSYAWTFSDGTTARGVTPTRSFADGSYTATLVVTDALGATSQAQTTTVTIGNMPPTPDAGPNTTVQIGNNFLMSGTFDDPGGATDGPWNWIVDWGDGSQTTGAATTLGQPIQPGHFYARYGTYTARLTVTDNSGASGSDDATIEVRDVTSVATLVGAGDIAECGSSGAENTARLLDTLPGTVITLGDNAYIYATTQDFMNCFDPTWGRHKYRMKPAVGNHEYEGVPGAADYYSYFGALAGDPTKGYYSYTAGEWLVVVLNSASGSGNRSATSPQVTWLKQLLAASNRQCTLAYMHHPQFTSADGRATGEWNVIDLWNALYEGGADLVLDGHDHDYERFAPQRPDGTLDTQFGIRQLTVGTGGGEGLYPFGVTIAPNSQKRINSSFGVIQLKLTSTGYSWEWIPVAGGTEHDSGSGTCHGRPDGTKPTNQAPVSKPGGPYTSEGTVKFDGTASFDPDNQVPLQYYWRFGDGSVGSGPTPTHTYATGGVYSASLVVNDALGGSSTAVSATVTIGNQPPVVNAGADSKAFTNSAMTFIGSFTDAGGSGDAPFSYTIAWGDGTTTTGSTDANGDIISVPHTYPTAGSFTARLTVVDKDGASGSDDRVITVTQPNRAPTARVGGPYSTEATVTLDATGSSDPDGDAITYAWNFGDGTTGAGLKPTKTYTADGTYTATLVVTDAYGLASAPVTTTVTVANMAPIVNAGNDVVLHAGDNYTLSSSWSDLGGSADAPFGWTIAWGDGTTSSGTPSSYGAAFGGTHGYPAPGQYSLVVSMTDKDGAVGVDTVNVRVGTDVLLAAGSIARCDKTTDEATAAILGRISGNIAALGDNQMAGAASDYTNCYGPSWGQYLSRTRPAPGENEYPTAGSAPYYNYFGASAGDPTKGYYSYDIGSSWHIVVLNSSIAMGTGSAQELWLKGDLAANTKQCILAYWHFPRFSAYNGSLRNDVKPLWDDLYAAGADVILNGHGLFYERFAQQTPTEVASTNGIREFIVSTGGQGLTAQSIIVPRVNSQVRIVGTYGVLALALDANSYSWQFMPVAGSTATDSGTTTCH